jgi:phosphate butyryltransferase
MKSLNDILALAKKIGPKKVAVALAEDEEVLLALEQARKERIIEAILVGTKEKIEKLARKEQIDIEKFEIDEETDGFEASLKCCELINKGEADLMMKGLVGTAFFMKAILDKEKGLGTGKSYGSRVGSHGSKVGLLSHVAVFEIPQYPKLLLITDAAINIAPSLMEKAQIIQNAIDVLHSLGIETPLVACIAAVEKVNPDKMPATVDCACLSKMGERGQIKDAIVDGPFGLDNAVSEKSAEVKGIKSQIAGKADIILCPNIETGNVIYKTLIEFAQAKCAAIVVGTKVPVILTSRADSHETKFMSIALGVASCKE